MTPARLDLTIVIEAGTRSRAVSATALAAIDYLYDALGRRVARRVGGTVTQRLLYLDDLRPAAELDTTGTRLVAVYLYASRRNVPDYVVTYGTNGSQTGTFRVVTDHLGSPRVVVNTTSGAVVASARYDEWGRELEYGAVAGWRHLPFGYAGGLVDRDPITGALVTKLVHFGAREYDPETRQWLTRDPNGFNGGSNLYGYAASDPVNKIDPDGNIPLLAGVLIDAAIGGALDLSIQLLTNGGRFECVSWRSVIGSAILGTLGGPFGFLGRSRRAVQSARAGFPGLFGMYAVEPVSSSASTIRAAVLPGGVPIGRAGSSAAIRVVTGGVPEAEAFFELLSAGGTEIAVGRYGVKGEGTLRVLSDGSRVGIRRISTMTADLDAPAATIDIFVEGLEGLVEKVKFVP